MSSHLELALRLVAGGQPVFPCSPSTKRPRTEHGFRDATTDEAQIRRWFSTSTSMVGVPTEDLIVVDLDVDANDNLHSWGWWLELAQEHEWTLGSTMIVRTPSRGLHIWWRRPLEVEVRNSASRLAEHVDVRSQGGYVIAPGSVSSTGKYRRISESSRRVADAPGWLLDLVRYRPPSTSSSTQRRAAVVARGGTTPYGARALEGICSELASAAVGTRNHSLNTASFRAGQLVEGGELTSHDAYDALLSTALSIGLAQHEAELTIRSGARAGRRAPRGPRR